MLAKESSKIDQLYSEEIKTVMALSSGKAGIKAYQRNCAKSCLSDSGHVRCSGYRGHTEVSVTVKGTKLYMVKCQNTEESNY